MRGAAGALETDIARDAADLVAELQIQGDQMRTHQVWKQTAGVGSA
jgi:hypothetical protein